MGSSPHPPCPSSRDDFEIAIICALRLEYDAVTTVFDGFWNDDGDPYGKVDGDQNTYTTGWIGPHNAVLALISDMGKTSATSVATSFRLSYPRVQLALLVGICGGVPKTCDGIEMLLGDVVVSQQLVQYDFGRRYPDRFRPKSTLAKDHAQSSSIHRFLDTMQTDRYCTLLAKKTLQLLMATQEKYPRKYEYFGAREDKLFQSEYQHKHRASAGYRICNLCTQESHEICDIALNSTCEDLKCDEKYLVYRRRLNRENTQKNRSQIIPPPPIVHFGIMASGDSVMKSALHRDEIAKSHNVIAFEMEGAGIFESLPCLVIKGVCDYADSHRNKKWQGYAAVTAACVMKTLLKWYPSSDRRSRPGSTEPTQNIAMFQQTNQDLQRMVRELTAQLRSHQLRLPPQVPCKDLVAVNDALGETYTLSLNLIDSLELFETVLRHKFEHVGLAKIERGEWMLQDHHTGQIWDPHRRWKAFVKPGQTLDMSMIFRKRNSLSILCPWCNTENESSSDEQHIECRKCSRRYRHIEEVNVIGLQEQESMSHHLLSSSIAQQDNDSASERQSQPKKKRRELESLATCPQPPQREPQDEGDDIHLYTRVQMVDVRFQVAQRTLKENASARLLMLSTQALEDMEHLAEHLAKVSGLSKEDCLAVVQDRYDDLLTLRAAAQKLHSTNTTVLELPESSGLQSLRYLSPMLPVVDNHPGIIRRISRGTGVAAFSGGFPDLFEPPIGDEEDNREHWSITRY